MSFCYCPMFFYVMKLLRNIYYLCLSAPKLFALNKAKGYYHTVPEKICGDLIESSRMSKDNSISKKTYRKIEWYMATTCFMGSLLAGLFKERICPIKQKALCCLGALMAINDVLVDEYRYSFDNFKELLKNDYHAKSDIERVFLSYHDTLVGIVAEAKLKRLLLLSEEGLYWQSESLKQLGAGLSKNELRHITEAKGGLSILLCAALFDNYNKTYEAPLYSLGAFVQYMNDAQDIFKDMHDNIHSFATGSKTIDEVISYLNAHGKNCFQQLMETTGGAYTNKALFVFNFYIMYWGIIYKLKYYKKKFGNNIGKVNTDNISKRALKVNMLSFGSLMFVLPRLLRVKI